MSRQFEVEGKFLEGATGAPKEKPGNGPGSLSILGAKGGVNLVFHLKLHIRFKLLNLIKVALRLLWKK